MCIKGTNNKEQELQNMADISPSNHNSHLTVTQKAYISNVFVALALISLAVSLIGGAFIIAQPFTNSIPIGVGMLTIGFACFAFFGQAKVR